MEHLPRATATYDVNLVNWDQAKLWLEPLLGLATDYPLRCPSNGNTHFPISDLNNVQIADEVSKFLSEKKLD